jgi:hypothetical protein
MAETKYLKCACAHCGGKIEFPAEGIGATVPCPHCGWKTELALEQPEKISGGFGVSRKWIIAGVVILFVGVVGVLGALFMARHLIQKAQRRAAAPAAKRSRPANGHAEKPSGAIPAALVMNDFAVSNVKIEKTAGSTLAYAAGTLKNQSDKQRFGVSVEIDLFDVSGKKLGAAKDYKDTIETNATWTFRALLVQKGVTSARVAAIREQQ